MWIEPRLDEARRRVGPREGRLPRAHARGDLEVSQPSWELSLWRDGQVRKYEVYFDAEQGPRAFAEREAEVAAAR